MIDVFNQVCGGLTEHQIGADVAQWLTRLVIHFDVQILRRPTDEQMQTAISSLKSLAQSRHTHSTSDQIGRASCRERV